MSDVSSGVPATVSAIQFNKQMTKQGLGGVQCRQFTISTDDPGVREHFADVYRLSPSEIDQFFIDAAKL